MSVHVCGAGFQEGTNVVTDQEGFFFNPLTYSL